MATGDTIGPRRADEAGDQALPAGEPTAGRMTTALCRLREQTGMSLKELERHTHSSDSSLSRYLAGQAVPPWTVVQALCRLADADPAALRPLWRDARRARLAGRAARARGSAPVSAPHPADGARARPGRSTADGRAPAPGPSTVDGPPGSTGAGQPPPPIAGEPPAAAVYRVGDRAVPGGSVRGAPPVPDPAAAARWVGAGPATADRDGAAVPPAQLPADVAGFTGRAEELCGLDRLLTRPAGAPPAVALLTGLAGTGKTALAVHWAHQVRDQFPDGQIYLNLRGHTDRQPVSPRQALTLLMTALSPAPPGSATELDAAAARYRSLVDGRRTLILLDDAASADQIRPLIPGTSGCVVLVTSRNRLEAMVTAVGATRIPLRPLAPRESVELLAAIVGAAQVRSEPDAAAAVAAWCGHLPLILRIAAARLTRCRYLPLGAAARELTAGGTAGAVAADADEQPGLRTALYRSYLRLPVDARRLLRRLGGVPERVVTVARAAELAGVPVPLARHLLDDLAAAHLAEQRDADRYDLNDLVHCFAGQCGGAGRRDGEASRSRQAHLAVLRSAGGPRQRRTRSVRWRR